MIFVVKERVASCTVCGGNGFVLVGACTLTRCLPCQGRGFFYVSKMGVSSKVACEHGPRGGEGKIKALLVGVMVLGCSSGSGRQTMGWRGPAPIQPSPDALASAPDVGVPDVLAVAASDARVSDAMTATPDALAAVPDTLPASPDALPASPDALPASPDTRAAPDAAWPGCEVPDGGFAGNILCAGGTDLLRCYAVRMDGGLYPANYPCSKYNGIQFGTNLYVADCAECPL